MEYRFLNYYCSYKAEVTINGEMKSLNNSRGVACFGSLFRLIENTRSKKINLKLKLECLINENNRNKNNLIILTKDETKWWLRRIQKIVNFKYNRTYTDDKLILSINATGNTLELKVLCTLLRVFFEYPENEIAKDVYDLKHIIKEKDGIKFTRISALNLFLFGCELSRANDIHSLIQYRAGVRPIRIKNLVSTLKENIIYRVNSCFNPSKNYKLVIFNDADLLTTKFWRDSFNNRVEKYKEICNREKSLLYNGQ